MKLNGKRMALRVRALSAIFPQFGIVPKIRANFLCMFRFFVDSHFFEKRSESKKKILALMYNKHTGRGVVLSI
ncbi:hypothetical protein, partial [Lacticaseibacillus mingshuiensis]